MIFPVEVTSDVLIARAYPPSHLQISVQSTQK